MMVSLLNVLNNMRSYYNVHVIKVVNISTRSEGSTAEKDHLFLLVIRLLIEDRPEKSFRVYAETRDGGTGILYYS